MMIGWLASIPLVLMVALCWVWVVAMARDMYGPMTGPSAWMMTTRWDWSHIGLLLAMWCAMMTAMMLPSTAPTLRRYVSPIRADSQRRVLVRVCLFAAGYLSVWMLFSLAATALQRVLSGARLLTPMMEPATHRIGGVLLLAAGVYQFLPVKRSCLSACCSPARLPRASIGAFRFGFAHGLTCLGCCWMLMLLLFAGGVMNLAVIVGLTAIVLIEKTAPFGMRTTQASG